MQLKLKMIYDGNQKFLLKNELKKLLNFIKIIFNKHFQQIHRFVKQFQFDKIFFNNQKLIGLSAFSNINYIGGSIRIENNTKLSSIDGLEGLAVIGNFTTGGDNLYLLGPGDDLIIKNNIALTNLDGLSNTTDLGGNLEVTGNIQLTDCDGLCGLFANDGIGGTINIANNPAPCSSEADLNSLCTVDINKFHSTTVLSVYPNPIHQFFSLSGTGKITKITIYDNLGRLIFTEKLPVNVISVANFPKGLALLEVVMDDIWYYRKILIE